MMPGIDYKRRLSAIEDGLNKKGLDSFLVTNETNVSYLSGFLGNDSCLLITGKKRFFITDSRFVEEAAGTLKGFDIELVDKSTYESVRGLVAKNRLKKVGFEAMNLPYEVATRLGRLIGTRALVPTKDFTEDLRAIKDPEEIDLIKKSIRLARHVLRNIARMARPGMSEERLARLVETSFIEKGAKAAFGPIIAQGRNSSKPHARPGRGRIADNDFVMVDIGCCLDSYCSDLTRMIRLGKIKEKFEEIYAIVRKAQELAIRSVRPGSKIRELDLAARRHINKKGFGKHFSHALGHGVGMEVHEKPSISNQSQGSLQPGMVFTIEPAVYIPESGGVRIEDMVLVTKNGCEILTR